MERNTRRFSHYKKKSVAATWLWSTQAKGLSDFSKRWGGVGWGEFPGRPVVRNQGEWVQTLIRELRSHKGRGAAKIKRTTSIHVTSALPVLVGYLLDRSSSAPAFPPSTAPHPFPAARSLPVWRLPLLLFREDRVWCWWVCLWECGVCLRVFPWVCLCERRVWGCSYVLECVCVSVLVLCVKLGLRQWWGRDS